MAFIDKVVTEGTPGTSRVYLNNGEEITNIMKVTYELTVSGARTILELDGVNIVTDDSINKQYHKYAKQEAAS